MTGALVLVGLGLLTWPASKDRLARFLPAARSSGNRRRTGLGSQRNVIRLAATFAGFGAFLVLGGGVGLVAGTLTALLADRLLCRLEPAASRRRRERRLAELPGVLDLLSAGLRTGLPLATALAITARCTRGSLTDDLARIADLSALGSGPAAAWVEYADDEALGQLARAATRSAESGSTLAEAFDGIAADLRVDASYRAEAAARKAGVAVMAPLGLCFLPAFMCLGVVPVVLGLLAEVTARV